MGRQQQTLEPSSSALAFFGDELRHYRSAAGLTQAQLAQAVKYSEALIAKVETARRSPSRELAESCDKALDTGGALSRMLPLIQQGHFPPWFRGFVELEATATGIDEFEAQIVPGLLQIEDYARAVIMAGPPRSPEEIDGFVEARMDRRRVLVRDSPQPPLLWVLLHENVLHCPIGGPAVMRRQLDYLLAATELPRIILQVVPLSAGAHAGLEGSITVLSFEDELPDLGYVESSISGVLIDRPDEVAECKLRLELLKAVALSPEASLNLIRSIMERS